MDDILVFAKNEEEHEKRLRMVLARLEAAGAILNTDKRCFCEHRIRFLGHMIDQNGISADSRKTAALCSMAPPKHVTELCCFLGMIGNQLGKFSSKLTQLSQPLRELLSSFKLHGAGELIKKQHGAGELIKKQHFLE